MPGSISAGGSQGGDLGKLGGSASNNREIVGLLQGTVLQILENLLGANAVDLSNPSAQIAYRFPEMIVNEVGKKEIIACNECSNCYQGIICCKHHPISSTNWHTDDLRRGTEHGFSLLLGIYLIYIFNLFI